MVALDPRTDKAVWAKEQQGVFLVHPRWVDAACYLWRRPPEEDYPVPDDASGRTTKSSFSKSVLVELRGGVDGDNKSGKGEVAAAAVTSPSPSAAAVVHVNGSGGPAAGSV